MQLQAPITAEELPIHLHIRGQSERTALRKLQPCNLQPLSSGGGHITYTLLHFHQNYHSHAHTRTHTHTHTHTLVLVVSLPGSLSSSMGALFTKVNSPSDSLSVLCVRVCARLCVSWCVCVCECQTCVHIPCVCACPLHLLCGPSWGVRAVLHVARPHRRAVQPGVGGPREAFEQIDPSLLFNSNRRWAYLNLKAWIHPSKCVLAVIILKGHRCDKEL